MDNKRKVKYAGFWRRLAAYIIDSIILGVLFILIYLAIGLPLVILGVNEMLTMGIIVLVLIIPSLGYHPYFLATRGATPGKSFMGLVVVDKTNRYPISWSTALIREILGVRIVDGLTFALGDLLIVIDSKKQALHDKIASTYVVHMESLQSDVLEHKED
jgi:uncharacterized RDD family membrane protein YckC